MKHFISLKRKLLYWIFFGLCIPTAVFLIFTISYARTAQNQEMERYTSRQIELLSDQMDWFIRSVQYVSKNYYNSDLVNSLAQPDHPQDRMQFMEDQLALLRMQKVNNYILEDKTLQVTVIQMDGKIYGTNIYRSDLIDQMSQTQWYQQLMKNPWLILWVQDSFLSELIHDTENDHLFNIWTLKDPETFEPIAFLIVDFRLKDLTEQFSAQFDERETLVVTDTYHNTILCGGSLSQEKATQMISQEESGQQIQSEYYCISTVPKSCNWTISLITDKTVAAGRYDSFSTLISIIFCIYVLLIISWIYYISNRLVKPVQRLTETMRLTQAGNIDVRSDIQSSDEFGELATAYNALLDRICQLLDSIVQKEEIKRQTEMQALYSQINPHFVINTLTAIRSLIFFGDTAAAEKAVCALSYLLRNTLSRESQMCSLGEELELVDKCIEIYQLSFEHPILVQFEVDPSLYDCRIIKMICQPVVENAVMHGLKAKQGQKKLVISAEEEETGLRIVVKDNGIGCNQKYAFHTVKMEFDKGIGLQNVHNRIALHHGSNYGVEFESHEGCGTKVTLHLPLIRGGEETYEQNDQKNIGS